MAQNHDPQGPKHKRHTGNKVRGTANPHQQPPELTAFRAPQREGQQFQGHLHLQGAQVHAQSRAALPALCPPPAHPMPTGACTQHQQPIFSRENCTHSQTATFFQHICMCGSPGAHSSLVRLACPALPVICIHRCGAVGCEGRWQVAVAKHPQGCPSADMKVRVCRTWCQTGPRKGSDPRSLHEISPAGPSLGAPV